jgi:hypothetical protein
MAPQPEPRNPFYFLLLIVGMLFIVTVLAYAVIPVMEQKAEEAGATLPEQRWSKTLDQDGPRWVLTEVALLVIFGLLSMGLDRYRRWKQEEAEPPAPPPTPAPAPDTNITTKVDSPPPG